MRCLVGLFLALALGVMGCSETDGTGGTAGDGGSGGDGGGSGGVPGHGRGGVGGDNGAIICGDTVCDDNSDCTTDYCELLGDPPRPTCVYEPWYDWCYSLRCADDPPPVCTFDGMEGYCMDATGQCCVDEDHCEPQQCETLEECDDFNDCTVDVCAATQRCADPVSVEDGTACAGGICEGGRCSLTSTVLPCTEQGVRNAVAAGGGPYTFDCDGPTTVLTRAEIGIATDVVLDAAGNLALDAADGHKLISISEGGHAELRGFTLKRGQVGVEVRRGGLILSNCVVSANAVGVAVNDGTLTILESQLAENGIWSVASDGVVAISISNSHVAGVFVSEGESEVTDSVIEGLLNRGNLSIERTDIQQSNYGINNQRTLVLTDSRVSQNVVGLLNNGDAYVTGSVFTDNHAPAGSTGRGAILNNAWTSTLYLYDSLIADNSVSLGPVSWRGGAGIVNTGTATVSGCAISNNHVEHVEGGQNLSEGGGVYNGGSLVIYNSTISGNSANIGGGLHNSGGDVYLNNSTIAANSADLGSAISNRVHVYVRASLIDGECTELNETCPGCRIFSNGSNIESPGDTCGFDATGDQVSVSAEQLNLGPLQDNGGPTETHALLPGSVAIDQIAAEDCVDADDQPLTTDQRGEPRDSMCDVGAFEVQP